MRVPVTERNAILTQADGSSWALSTERFTEAPTRWLLIDIVGWYGGSGVRSTVTDRYRHGDFPSRGWREGRTISLRGAAISKTSMTRDDVERELSGILWDGQEGTLAVQEADDRVLWTTVRLDGAPSIEKLDERAIEFSIPLRSAEPFVYGPWREGTLTLPGAGVGLEYPLFSKTLSESKGPVLTFGAAIDTEVTMWNNGNATSYPQIEVVGDLPGGFAVTIGSRRVTYPWPTFPDMPVLVDMSGSLSVSGQDQSHRLVERNWTGIEQGGVETPRLDPLQGGTGWAVVRHRDTYI